MSIYGNATISNNFEILPGIWQMELYAPQIADKARPGQFINLYPNDSTLLLPRPISLSEILPESLRIIYRIVGNGTKQFSTLQNGSQIKIMGPLGNGFVLPSSVERSIVIGGGLGIPPLIELTRRLKGSVEVFLGFRQQPFLVEEFKRSDVTVHVATQDGCQGYHGNIIGLLEHIAPTGSNVFACGPRPMLHSVANWAEQYDIPAQLSIEERMACGLGACLGCAIKIRKSYTSDWEYLKVCKDGPVFWGKEVIWDE